jgi:hypothetical protein
MSTSTREAILAAVKAQLVAANIANGRVYRGRREQIPDVPSIEIERVSGNSSEIALGAMDHDMKFSVAVVAKGDTPDTAADATLLAVHAALIADRSLGLGNGVLMRPDFESELEIDNYDFARSIHHYTVTYRTTGADF